MIVGSSHGGLAAFYTAVRHSAKFGFCGAMSPSFWVGVDDATNFPTVKAKNDKRLSDSQLVAMVRSTLTKSGTRPNFYLDWGLMRQGGPHNASIEERATYRGREMADLLIREFGYQIGTDLMVYEDPRGEHREESWGKHVPRVIEWFLCGI
jgi:predicted alpha/beta superfamily hydrolase